jgi:heterodisulfide reductase subunit C
VVDVSSSKQRQEIKTKQGEVISFTEMDPAFKYEVSAVPGAENVMVCFQCGTCTASCPIARFTVSYRPNKLIHMIQLGLRERVLTNDDIWLCTTCFTCIDRCPQDVGFANIVRAIRNLSVQERRMPDVYTALASTIRRTGYAYVIPASRLKRRDERELPPLPKADVDAVAKLFEATGLSKTLDREEV